MKLSFAAAFTLTQGADVVVLLRHCVRSPYATLRANRAAPGFQYPDNYTAQIFPTEWDTEQAQCTPRGLDQAERLGAALKEHLPAPVVLRADNVTRCVATAGKVASGLGVNPQEVKVQQQYFDPAAAKVCPDLSGDQYNASIEEQLQVAQDKTSYLGALWDQREELIKELQEMVGRGPAPALEDIPDVISGGYYVGGMYVASQGMLETFLLEAGSGLSVAWGALDGDKREELYTKWQGLNVLYNRINHGGTGISTRYGGATAWRILNALEDPAAGSEVLVGHDFNLDGVAKMADLYWQCGKFAPNSAQPLQGLAFRRVEAGILMAAVCVDYEADNSGDAVFGEVKMGSQDVSQAPVMATQLRSSVAKRIDVACVQNDTALDVLV